MSPAMMAKSLPVTPKVEPPLSVYLVLLLAIDYTTHTLPYG